jgi:TIR domain
LIFPESHAGALSPVGPAPKPSGGSALYRWDFFLAHAGADAAFAEALYDRLTSKARVFLDSRVLLAGDDWDRELQKAQHESRVTVVLISAQTDGAYYVREEIAAALELARHDSDRHRVIPVYLDGGPDRAIPYGLRLKHGLLVDSHTASATDQLVTQLLLVKARLDARIDSTTREPGANELHKSRSHIYIAKLVNPPDGIDVVQARSTIWLAATGPETYIVDSISIEHTALPPMGPSLSGAVPPDASYQFTFTQASYRIHSLEPALRLSPDDRREVSMTLGLSLEGWAQIGGYVTARLHYHTYEGQSGALLLRSVPEEMAELSRLLDADVRAYLDQRIDPIHIDLVFETLGRPFEWDRLVVTPPGVQRGDSGLTDDFIDYQYFRIENYVVEVLVNNANHVTRSFPDRERLNQALIRRGLISYIIKGLESGKELYFDLCSGLQDEESLAALIRVASTGENAFDKASRALAIRHLLLPSPVLAQFVIQNLEKMKLRVMRGGFGRYADPRRFKYHEPPDFYALLAAPVGEWLTALVGLLQPLTAEPIWKGLLSAFTLLAERLSDAERAIVAAKQEEYAQLEKLLRVVERQIILEFHDAHPLNFIPVRELKGLAGPESR